MSCCTLLDELKNNLLDEGHENFRVANFQVIQRFQTLQEQVEILEAKREFWMAEKPSVPMIMSIADGEVGNARIHVRGNPQAVRDQR